MSRIRPLGTLFVLAALCASAIAYAAAAPKGKPAAADKAAKIKKGEYLTTIMGCNDCHTPGTFYGAPDFDRKLSGSDIGWKGPWGVSFARNLTPDAETGIGYYSEDEIVHSFRTGIKPNGGPMLPPMPWPAWLRLRKSATRRWDCSAMRVIAWDQAAASIPPAPASSAGLPAPGPFPAACSLMATSKLCLGFQHLAWRRKWQSTPAFLCYSSAS